MNSCLDLTIEQLRLQREKSDRMERCANCSKLYACNLKKDENDVCPLFDPLPIERQTIIVSLLEFSRLQGVKYPTCSY